jgi:hypothetical protein
MLYSSFVVIYQRELKLSLSFCPFLSKDFSDKTGPKAWITTTQRVSSIVVNQFHFLKFLSLYCYNPVRVYFDFSYPGPRGELQRYQQILREFPPQLSAWQVHTQFKRFFGTSSTTMCEVFRKK